MDRSIQVHGALGTTNAIPLARLWAYARILRLADGPDEVHNMVIARREVRRMKEKLAQPIAAPAPA